jgi:hypothetical protein
MGKFSKKAKRKAARNRAKSYRSDQRLKGGPVTVSYLPGFSPPSATPTGPDLDPARLTRTRLPFRATINGRGAIVSRSAYGIEIEYPDERTDDDPSQAQPDLPAWA